MICSIPPLLFAAYLIAHTTALSVPPTLSLTSNFSGAVSAWHCTTADTWLGPELDPDDCAGVLEYLVFETWDGREGSSKDFRAPGARSGSKKAVQWTPRKYTFGTCTLAIVMVVDFPDPNSLPGGRKTGPLSDTATYVNIWRIAKNLVDSCVTKGEMGWQPTGAHEGIGVFIWATDSHEDQVIEADEPRLAFLSSELTANGSVAST